MSITPVAGAQYDLYREQFFNNTAATYTGATYSDDYRFNIAPACPARPNLTPSAPYTSLNAPVGDDWHTEDKGDFNKAAWLTAQPVIPGQ